MKAIILVAGYATRLYPLTLNKPKALLEVNEKPIIDYILEEIETINEIDEVLVITNDRFYGDFSKWKEDKISSKPIKVINDGTNSDENKLGAIGDIRFLIEEEKIIDDIVIIAGDNLFTYKLKDMYDYFKKVDKDLICAHELDNPNELKRMAIALLDENNKVLDLEEKPQNPKSNLAVYATYMYKKETLPLFDEYIKLGNKPDAPGYFPSWLYKKKDIYAYIFDGECYDIGTPDAYAEVQEIFKKRNNKPYKFDSIIFDLDGTLWDSTPRVLEAWQKVIKDFDQIKEPLTKKHLESVFGVQHNLIGKTLFPYLEESVVDDLMEKCYRAEVDLLKEFGGHLYDDLEDVLNELSEKYPLFIVSNCQSGYIETFLEYHNLNKYFKDFECSGNTEMPKDHNIKLIIERNKLKAPIYVGDTMGDYKATKLNNIPFVFAKYGFGTVEAPDYIVEKLKGLIELAKMLDK